MTFFISPLVGGVKFRDMFRSILNFSFYIFGSVATFVELVIKTKNQNHDDNNVNNIIKENKFNIKVHPKLLKLEVFHYM